MAQLYTDLGEIKCIAFGPTYVIKRMSIGFPQHIIMNNLRTYSLLHIACYI